MELKCDYVTIRQFRVWSIEIMAGTLSAIPYVIITTMHHHFI